MRPLLVCMGIPLLAWPAAGQVLVSANGQTDVVPASPGAADVALWVHPNDVTKSLIIGTDVPYGLATYGLDGKEFQRLAAGNVNGVDLRYNFSLAGRSIALVAVTNQSTNVIGFYTVDSNTRLLRSLSARALVSGPAITTGIAVCQSFLSGKTYAVTTDQAGVVRQWEVFDNGDGGVDGNQVRMLALASGAEGCVCDDALGQLYVAQDAVGIWKYGLEPSSGTSGLLVDSTDGGHLAANVKGLSVYHAHNGAGYLLASSQGNSTFSVYQRQGANAYVGAFQVGFDGGRVTMTNGQDVTSFNLGSPYSEGLFVAQDFANGANQNFKLVQWDVIAGAFVPSLIIDNGLDPRLPEPAPDGGLSDGGSDGGGSGGTIPGQPMGTPGKGTGCGCNSGSAAALLLAPLALPLAASRRRRLRFSERD